MPQRSPTTDAPPVGSPMLHRLAAEKATGSLMRERGTLYLSDGQVIHAESPDTPGLDVLLTAGGALSPEQWGEALTEAGPQQLVGRFLVDRGHFPEGALELCHLGALYDAAFFVLGRGGGPARFRYGVAHWMGAVRPVPVDAVQRETSRRREMLNEIWPEDDTDTQPLVQTGLGLDTGLPRRQRAVAELVDGVRTAADISRALGRPAFHTLVDVRRLAAAGIVTAARRPPRAANAPTRLPETSAAPDVSLLRRIKNALEAL
ncbi:transcriptional regulator [Streptomyces spongiae]|uniref:Transcriptional regulator n=1 Tax=Streptomyces spongiae TaxID=565072 RepID=A0A5N8XGV8_9ACTN|nr:transcriptional regulator [Streptomyces spongiae]MPY58474.1 transcriptional regulator [Streptomyces spongiae]